MVAVGVVSRQSCGLRLPIRPEITLTEPLISPKKLRWRS
jgi:hypothetical protein